MNHVQASFNILKCDVTTVLDADNGREVIVLLNFNLPKYTVLQDVNDNQDIQSSDLPHTLSQVEKFLSQHFVASSAETVAAETVAAKTVAAKTVVANTAAAQTAAAQTAAAQTVVAKTAGAKAAGAKAVAAKAAAAKAAGPIYFHWSASYWLQHRHTLDQRRWTGSFFPKETARASLSGGSIFSEFNASTFVSEGLATLEPRSIRQALTVNFFNSNWQFYKLISAIVSCQLKVPINHPFILNHDLLQQRQQRRKRRHITLFPFSTVALPEDLSKIQITQPTPNS